MSKMHRNHGRKRTAGFSLVEMLVVMAIIAILVSLTAAAVFKVIGVQRANNTVLTVKSASSLLDKQWAAVISQAKNEQIPSSVMTLAGYDPARARVIWTKLRLRQEFPMNISEALYPYVAGTTTALSVSDLPGKKYYFDRITKAFPSQFTSPAFPGFTWPSIPANYLSATATNLLPTADARMLRRLRLPIPPNNYGLWKAASASRWRFRLVEARSFSTKRVSQ